MSIPDDIKRALEKAAASGRFKSLEELQAFTADLMAEYNRRPQPELCGLSPEQIHKLIDFEWETAGSAVRLNHHLTLADLKNITWFNNARVFLERVDASPIKATVAGNLNRKFVALMIDDLVWEDDYLSAIRERNKVINEEDVWPLHMVRVLLDLAGMIKKRKGYFSATAKGKVLLAPDKAGKLYASLFKACFTRLNLAYLDSMPDNEALQVMIAVPLYILSGFDKNWFTPAELRDRVWPEVVRDLTIETEYYDYLVGQTETRLLRPLAWFGLVDRESDGAQRLFKASRKSRITPLYARFLNFNFPSNEPNYLSMRDFGPGALPH